MSIQQAMFEHIYAHSMYIQVPIQLFVNKVKMEDSAIQSMCACDDLLVVQHWGSYFDAREV